MKLLFHLFAFPDQFLSFGVFVSKDITFVNESRQFLVVFKNSNHASGRNLVERKRKPKKKHKNINKKTSVFLFCFYFFSNRSMNP